jgi:tape measure domain-containing protein
MSKPIDELVVQIKADTKQLQKDLKQVQGKLKTTGVAGGAAFGGMAGAMSKAKVGALAVTGALVAVGATISKIAQVGMGFEDLRDSINTVFGGIDQGEQAMQKIFTFAQTTPFQIEDVTKAFIQLKAVGVEPSMDMLQTFADTASTSVDQLGAFQALVRITQRAASGGLGLEELNQLDERGIPALKILTTELGMTKEELTKFGKTTEGAATMIDTLVAALNKQFGGAMTNKMDNLSTKASNMGIAFKQLADAVFTGGLGDRLKKLTDRLTAFANESARSVRVATGQATLGDIVEDRTGKTDKLSDVDQLKLSRNIIREYTKDINKLLQLKTQSEDGTFPPVDFTVEDQMELEILQREVKLLEQVNKKINARIEAERQLKLEKKDDDKKTGEFTPEQKFIEFLTPLQKLAKDAEDPLKEINAQLALIDEILQSEDKTELLKFYGLTEEQIGAVVDSLGLLKEEIGQVEESTDALDILNNVFKEATGDIGQLDTIYKALNESMAEGVLTQEQATAKLREFLETTGPYGKALAQIGSEIEGLASSLSNDLTDALLNGESALESFKSFAQNVVQAVISAFMELMVIQPIVDAILGSFGMSTPKGGVGTGTGTGGGMGMGKAGGGTIQGGTPTLVGERGAEIFVPNTGGTIMNNMNTKNAMGGGTPVNIYQTISFATGIVPTVRAEVTKMMPQIADVTKAAVQESAMRGGNFRRSLVGG